MRTTGGRFFITVNGTPYRGRGEAQIMPSLATIEAGANWDGSGYCYVEPHLAEITLALDRQGTPTQFWTEGQLLAVVNVTFKETDSGYVHILTGAAITGRPQIDTKEGKVEGITFKSDAYMVKRG